MNITSITLSLANNAKEHLLVIYEEHVNRSSGRIAFFRWEPTEFKFVQNNLFQAKKIDLMTQKLTHFGRIEHDGVHHLYLEILEIKDSLYNQYVLLFDAVNMKWITKYQFNSEYSRSFVTLSALNKTCLGSYSSEQSNVVAHCDGAEFPILITRPNKMVS